MNETGGTVTDVRMELRGRAVGGMIPRRNWSIEQAEIADGGGVEAAFRKEPGADADPPRMEITWTTAAGDRRKVVLDDLPL
jgi:hypothetical protein